MKTEDLKALGLNDDQVQRVFAMNGEELNSLKASVATLTAERDTARTNLADANKKLEGYDPEWKAKAAQAQQQADQKVAELKAGYAADSAASGLKFTSDSAKKAFLSDLKAKTCRYRTTAPCWALTTMSHRTRKPTRAPLPRKAACPV